MGSWVRIPAGSQSSQSAALFFYYGRTRLPCKLSPSLKLPTGQFFYARSGSNPSWITKQTMLRKEHLLFDERNKTLVLIPRRKKQMRSHDTVGTHCLFCRSPLQWIMPPPGGIIPAKLKDYYCMLSNPPSLQAVPFAKIAHRAIFLRSVRFESQLDHKTNNAPKGAFVV